MDIGQLTYSWSPLTIGATVVPILAVGALGILLIRGGDGGSENTSSPSTTAGVTALPSAAGKPCVPVADPPSEGAPAVPVKVGRPPAALVAEDVKPGAGALVTPRPIHHRPLHRSGLFDREDLRLVVQPRGARIVRADQRHPRGWEKGIPGMKVGGQRLLGIPPDMGYGDNGGSEIAPGETLWFVVEILEAQAA